MTTASRTVNIENKTLTSANTEYYIELPPSTSKISFQCRTSADVRYAFVTGKVATPTAPYFTLKSGGEKTLEEMNFGGRIYFASGSAGVIIELEYWG